MNESIHAPERVPEIRGILVCKDLFFIAGVTATAKTQGLGLKVCPGLSGLKAMLDSHSAIQAVVIDMNLIDPSEPRVWQAVRALVKPPIILACFGSHVETARFAAAEAAGFDHVLARSAFSGRLVHWLNDWFGPRTTT